MLEVLRHTKQRHRKSQRKSIPQETLEEVTRKQISVLESQRDKQSIEDSHNESEEELADDES